MTVRKKTKDNGRRHSFKIPLFFFDIIEKRYFHDESFGFILIYWFRTCWSKPREWYRIGCSSLMQLWCELHSLTIPCTQNENNNLVSKPWKIILRYFDETIGYPILFTAIVWCASQKQSTSSCPSIWCVCHPERDFSSYQRRHY